MSNIDNTSSELQKPTLDSCKTNSLDLNKPTPPLPARSKTADLILLDSNSPAIANEVKAKSTNDVNDHYAHLDKHLKEVRRKKRVSHLQAPVLSTFQKKEDDKVVSTDWINYLKSWIEYIVSYAANDDIAKPLEPFSLSRVKHDFERFYPMISPFIEPLALIRSIYRWESKSLTGTIATVYLFLWYYELILATILFGFIVGVFWIRVDTFAEYSVDALEEQVESENNEKSWNRTFWTKIKSTVKKSDTFDLLNDMSITELRGEVYKKHGPKIQVMISDTVDYAERIKNLITWKRPEKTRFLLLILGCLCFTLSIIPSWVLAKMIPLYIWFEFFVLQALRSHYPRHRKLFNPLNLLLQDIPNDAEYALEVVRILRTKPAAKTSTVDNSSSSLKMQAGLRQRSNTNQDLSASSSSKTANSTMSNISDTLLTAFSDKALKLQEAEKEKGTIQETVTANVATLALLASSSAVNKFKDAIDKRDESKKKEKENTVDKANAFGCMYQGTIPGRIVLRDNDFVFQTSRMTGGKTLVECTYNDIVGVKKTKQYNVGIWHSTGLDVSLSDGKVLKFEHVLKRDDCFNNLVSASNEEGSEWKKT